MQQRLFVPEPLPSYCKPIYERVWQSVTSSAGSEREGRYKPSIEMLSDDEAVAVAKDVVELAYRVREAVNDDRDRRRR